MSSDQIRTLRARAATLRAELDHECSRHEATRQRIRRELDEVLAQLDAAEPHVGGAQ